MKYFNYDNYYYIITIKEVLLHAEHTRCKISYFFMFRFST